MERQVKVSVQRWEPMGGGRVKVKIAEKQLNISNIIHGGVPFVTVKKMGRGRYVMRQDPTFVVPVEEPQEEAPDLQIDTSPEPLPVDPGRAPMAYSVEVQP